MKMLGAERSSLRWNRRLGVQRYLRIVTRLVQMTPGETSQRARIALRARLGSGQRHLIRDEARAEATAAEFLAALGSQVRGTLCRDFDSLFFFGP